MIVSGSRQPQFLARAFFYTRFGLAQRLGLTVTVREGTRSYTYRCSTYTEYKRAATLLEKEAGTVRWLDETLQEGDVFHDIGANIGLYSIYAAARIGEHGQVAAFEPHPANTMSLLTNLALNGLRERARVLSCALHDESGFFAFNLRHAVAGSSMSQLGSTIDGDGETFEPVMTEQKYAVTLDELVEKGAVRSPDVVKIDVDGNELRVLGGMTRTLSANHHPRSIQVEVNHRYNDALDSFMSDHGYALVSRHHTSLGKRAIAGGADSLHVPHNAVYEKYPS